MTTLDLSTIVPAAATGDHRAWNELVTYFTPVIAAIARRHRLGHADRDEVLQRTWLALVRNIRGLSNPEALGGWLATTARHESLNMLRAARREVPSPEVGEEQCVEVEDRQTADARLAAVRKAIQALSPSDQALLELLVADPRPSYQAISDRLGIAVGSIGPTRGRCVERLRRDPDVAALLDESFRPRRSTRRAAPTRDDVL